MQRMLLNDKTEMGTTYVALDGTESIGGKGDIQVYTPMKLEKMDF